MQETTPAAVYTEHLAYLRKLAGLAQGVANDARVAARYMPAGAEKNPRRFCDLRMKALSRQIQDMETRLTE